MEAIKKLIAGCSISCCNTNSTNEDKKQEMQTQANTQNPKLKLASSHSNRSQTNNNEQQKQLAYESNRSRKQEEILTVYDNKQSMVIPNEKDKLLNNLGKNSGRNQANNLTQDAKSKSQINPPTQQDDTSMNIMSGCNKEPPPNHILRQQSIIEKCMKEQLAIEQVLNQDINKQQSYMKYKDDYSRENDNVLLLKAYQNPSNNDNSVSYSAKLRPDHIDISSFSPPKENFIGYQALMKKQQDMQIGAVVSCSQQEIPSNNQAKGLNQSQQEKPQHVWLMNDGLQHNQLIKGGGATQSKQENLDLRIDNDNQKQLVIPLQREGTMRGSNAGGTKVEAVKNNLKFALY